MKVLFKNKTRYSREIYKEFLEFHQEKYGTSYYIYTIGVILALLFCIVMQFKSANYLVGLLTTIILLAFVFWRFHHPVKIVQKELKSKKIETEQEFTFKFYEKNFLIYSQKVNSKVYYWQLKKVFDTNDYFYLYIDKTHAFLISKVGFEIGNSEEFKEFMKRKCRFKYRNREKVEK